jgi:hypothetical protein
MRSKSFLIVGPLAIIPQAMNVFYFLMAAKKSASHLQKMSNMMISAQNKQILYEKERREYDSCKMYKHPSALR